MIEETAQVIGQKGELIVLEAETHSACESCSVNKGCGTSVLSKWVGRKFTRFELTNTVNARIGDRVVVGLSESALLRGSLFVYLLPLLSMLIFALAADALLSPMVDFREPMIVLAALSGLGVAIHFGRKILSNVHIEAGFAPVILRKVL